RKGWMGRRRAEMGRRRPASAAHARDGAGGEAELAVEPELELAAAAAQADEALAVGVADLEPHVDLGHEGLDVEVEAPADQVRVRRAPWLGLARADAHAALLLRLVAVAQRCLDRLGQAVPHVLGR